ncbi:protein phosphatase 2C [Cordyceps fumosorosea ARSEF 2679]|uniref:Protein phosphatase 2C n=1 Tax=Cordyceps fumosorosea (strain ARSEF 2679) TaxID=1081104 RepID=A0A167SAZ7_CORFA|nr:protein phosphatase 2C [Cordyceps fumosorosea ARSEF 2679]OAA59439.1 protein phosphatase 2C [Cordyceps fumosorosea ARSEF 2679]
MHRAALRAFRTTCQTRVRSTAALGRPSLRSLLSSTIRPSTVLYPSGSASLHSSTAAAAAARRPQTAASLPLRSSMFFRRIPAALVSSIVVGYGAWYSYNGGASWNLANATGARSLTSTSGQAPLGTATGAASATLPTRTVLVVGADELRQGTIVGEEPIYKTTSDGRRIVEMLTPEQATEKLRKTEESFSVNRGQGVTRYDLVQLSSNDPIEDDHAEKIVEIKALSTEAQSNDWMFWGVFDGHSGWTTSATLRESLISYVARELNDTYKTSKEGMPTADAIDLAIKTGFTQLDNEIVHKSVEKVFSSSSKAVAAELLQPAMSGSCALLSFYDADSQLLRVAVTGDSRAVLGRRSANGKWTATALSEDQTGGNPSEAARLRSEHPGEDNVVRNGRVLGGLEPTRAFGDAVYKWSRETTIKLKKGFFARSQSPLLKTPPYVTAEPVVTTTKISPENGDFLVLATDGLWEMLTNDEVVGLVGQWIESEQARTAGGAGSHFEAAWAKVFGASNKALPVEQSKALGENGGDGQRVPIRMQQWGNDPEAKGRFVVKDKNVATHLVRNALGGSNDEQVRALLTLPAPFSRRYRDDLTVQVIFFGNGPRTGEVTVNHEATANNGAPRAKL